MSQEVVEVVEPTLVIAGAGNTDSIALLNPYTVGGEAIDTVSKFTSSQVDGLNGKQVKGSENPINLHNGFAAMSDVGSVIVEVARIKTAKKISFPDIDDNTVRHVAYYDPRKKDPFAYFHIEKKAGEEKSTTTKKEIPKKLFLKDPTIGEEELRGAFNATATIVNKSGELGIGYKEGFGQALQFLITKKANKQIKEEEYTYGFIQIFSDYYIDSGENKRKVKSVLLDLDDKYPSPKISEFASLSDSYNRMAFRGIPIDTESKAIRLAELLKKAKMGEISENPTERDIQLYLSSIKDFNISIKVEESTTIGVGIAGEVFITENSNIPRLSSSYIMSQELNPLLENSKNALKTIKDKYNSLKENYSGYIPDSNVVLNAEMILKNEALAMAISFDNGKSSKDEENALNSIISKMGNASFKLESNNPEFRNNAISDMSTLQRYIQTMHMKEFIQKSSTVENGMMVKDGSRIKGAFYATSQSINPLERWDAKPSDVHTVNIQASLPLLTFPPSEDGKVFISNFKEVKANVVSVFIGKEVGEDGKLNIIGIEKGNDIRFWQKAHARAGLVLDAIVQLSASDEKLDEKLNNLINFGGTHKNVATGFGLLGLKKDENGADTKLGQVYGKLFQSLRDLVYTDKKFDVSKLDNIQEDISNLSQSKNQNEKNLGMYVESVHRNKEKNAVLQNTFFIAASNELSVKTVDYLNDAKASFPDNDAFQVLRIKNAAVIIASSIKLASPTLDKVRNVENGTDKSTDNAIITAQKIAKNIRYSKSLPSAVITSKNTFISTPTVSQNKLFVPATIYDGASKTTSFNPSIFSFLQKPESLDTKSLYALNSKEYRENKTNKVSSEELLYDDEKQDFKSGGIELDLAGIAHLIPDGIKSPSQEEVQQPTDKITSTPSTVSSTIDTEVVEQTTIAPIPLVEIEKAEENTQVTKSYEDSIIDAQAELDSYWGEDDMSSYGISEEEMDELNFGLKEAVQAQQEENKTTTIDKQARQAVKGNQSMECPEIKF